MNTFAHWAGNGGPGPWILLFPLIWAAVIAGIVLLLRRTVWRRGRGPWQHRGSRPANEGTQNAVDLLAHRFASGEIDEDEYWTRLSVLNESKPGAA